ncbi:hypothetical protein ABG067_009326 [Albugo candida]
MSPVHDRPTRPIPRPTSSNERSKSPEANMAKPPKVNFISSRPGSTSGEILPPVPKRSMPPLPETTIVPNHFDQAPVERKSHPNTALPSTPLEDAVDIHIRQWMKQETEKLRKEFELRLEQERTQRLQLQVELDELKAILNQ